MCTPVPCCRGRCALLPGKVRPTTGNGGPGTLLPRKVCPATGTSVPRSTPERRATGDSAPQRTAEDNATVATSLVHCYRGRRPWRPVTCSATGACVLRRAAMWAAARDKAAQRTAMRAVPQLVCPAYRPASRPIQHWWAIPRPNRPTLPYHLLRSYGPM